EIDRRLAEIDRHELRMDVGHVEQSEVAERLEPGEFRLGEALLRYRAADWTEPIARRDCGRRSADLQDFAAIDHDVSVPVDCPCRQVEAGRDGFASLDVRVFSRCGRWQFMATLCSGGRSRRMQFFVSSLTARAHSMILGPDREIMAWGTRCVAAWRSS